MRKIYLAAIAAAFALALCGCSGEKYPQSVGVGESFRFNGSKGIDMKLDGVVLLPDQNTETEDAYGVVFTTNNMATSFASGGKVPDNDSAVFLLYHFAVSFFGGAVKSTSLTVSDVVTVPILVNIGETLPTSGLITFENRKGEPVSITLDLSGADIPEPSARIMDFGEVVAVIDGVGVKGFNVTFKPAVGDFAPTTAFKAAFQAFYASCKLIADDGEDVKDAVQFDITANANIIQSPSCLS